MPGLVLVVGAVWLTGCHAPDSERDERHVPSRVGRIDRSLSAAARFLSGRQSSDGAWRSDTYGAFKDGGSLTPLVLHALSACPEGATPTAALAKGADSLAALVQPDGTIDAGPHGLSYPVYTSATAVIVLSQPGNVHHRQARDAWLAYLRQRQLTEDLGWQPSDKEYGGWGFASGLPRKPAPGELAPPLTESNLSATVFALEALRSAGCPAQDPAFAKALTFVERCQNYRAPPEAADPVFEDGGFFFIADDAVRNKAGVAGRDERGRERYRSYGSTTADGLRALLACGLPPEHGRVVAARRWLERNFRAETHPGDYVTEREGARPAVYYYYCWSAARALKASGVRELMTDAGQVCWAEVLADELLKRQRDNGSWVNAVKAVREDDPVVATCLAAGALAACRASLERAPSAPLPDRK
jgi:squalene-hopene/tetraprenyl-beta-curcumene cyclase